MSVLKEFYPGSKTPIPPMREVVVDEEPEDHWSASPVVKTIKGKEMSFYTISSLAQAVGRSQVSVRLWERKGYIPRSPYRMPDHKGGRGKRLYTRAIIEATIQAFAQAGVLDPGTRIQWGEKHKDLTADLVSRWTQVVEMEMYELNKKEA